MTLSQRSEAKLLTTHTRTATAVGMLRWTRRRLRKNKKETRGGSDSDLD